MFTDFLTQRHEEGTKYTTFFGTPIGEIGVILKISFTPLSLRVSQY